MSDDAAIIFSFFRCSPIRFLSNKSNRIKDDIIKFFIDVVQACLIDFLNHLLKFIQMQSSWLNMWRQMPVI